MELVEGVSLSMERLSIDSTYSHLPEDVLFIEILTKLDVKDLSRFNCVSKTWLARISSDSFITSHLQHHSDTRRPYDLTRAMYDVDDDDITDDDDIADDNIRLFVIAHGESTPVEMDMSFVTKAQKRSEKIKFFHLLGSSNGLVLIQQFYDYEDKKILLVVLNPETRKFRNLPEPIVPRLMQETSSHCGHHNHGIGFDRDSNDYKIVRVAEFHTFSENGVRLTVHVQLYTKTSGCWRELAVLSDYELIGNVEGGAVIDGAIHWVISRVKAPAKDRVFRVLRFDLHSEELKEIDGPASKSVDLYNHLELIKWKGFLCALMTTRDEDCEFWLMSNDLCWTKMSIIKPPVSLWPFRGVLRDEFLLFDDVSRQDLLYDPLTCKTRLFKEEFGMVISYNFQHYMPSLISPS